ncbi:MAG: DegT/DnrJ/EryC1/StrS family aminotransferase [Candidatus Liptonbacteria bacterium]|nr:DegT/DnrJ/EryC1/StrS family aminotransferase [Candidatus Liptonbacteria bacterium]
MNNFKIKLIKSAFMDENETRRKLADFVMRTEFFSMGEECKKYEEAFAKKQERKFAVFVNSGSSANLILVQALLNLGKLKRGDKVGVSAITWSTNVMPLLQLGLVPVAIDCEKESLNVSSSKLEPYLKEIRGLFLTNALGFCHDIKEIRSLCEEREIVFLEDNCESLGSKAYGRLLGNFGLASTFSFFLGHHLSTLEGGMVCTDDEELYHMLLKVRAHGWGRNLPKEKLEALHKEHGTDPFYALYSFFDLGYNVRPTEINGFLGNLQIQYWDEVVASREKNFKFFNKKKKENNDLLALSVDHMDTVSAFAMPIICKDKTTFESYKNKFTENGVEIRPIVSGDITSQPFYKKYINSHGDCPNARFVHQNGFYFGNTSELNEGELGILYSLI